MPMTVKKFKQWVASLPEEVDDFEVCGDMGGYPIGGKRVFVCKWKTCGGGLLVVNAMGSHLKDDFYRKVEIIGTIFTGLNTEE